MGTASRSKSRSAIAFTTSTTREKSSFRRDSPISKKLNAKVQKKDRSIFRLLIRLKKILRNWWSKIFKKLHRMREEAFPHRITDKRRMLWHGFLRERCISLYPMRSLRREWSQLRDILESQPRPTCKSIENKATNSLNFFQITSATSTKANTSKVDHNNKKSRSTRRREAGNSLNNHSSECVKI